MILDIKSPADSLAQTDEIYHGQIEYFRVATIRIQYCFSCMYHIGMPRRYLFSFE